MIKFFILLSLCATVYSCDLPFEGFGVFIGSLDSLNETTPFIRDKVIDYLYNDLKIRNFRTEYLAEFSLRENEYFISCSTKKSCTWLNIHSKIFKLPGIRVFATIWTPPHYMKKSYFMLDPKYENKYYSYISIITDIIKTKFNFTIEKISLVNEPENIFAPWDHVVMNAEDLCKLINKYNDSRMKICSENAYFWLTNIYTHYKSSAVDCKESCEIIISHGYKLNLLPFSMNFGKVYYDLTIYKKENKPIWITEISSTYHIAEFNQIEEAIDFSNSIINFVAKTCVQRFYYWLAFSTLASGESLIWSTKNNIVLPKKYFALRHFTRAAYQSSYSYDCSAADYLCVQFDNKPVYLNKNLHSVSANYTCKLCCTTKSNDYWCYDDYNNFTIPSQSICSCQD